MGSAELLHLLLRVVDLRLRCEGRVDGQALLLTEPLVSLFQLSGDDCGPLLLLLLRGVHHPLPAAGERLLEIHVRALGKRLVLARLGHARSAVLPGVPLRAGAERAVLRMRASRDSSYSRCTLSLRAQR